MDKVIFSYTRKMALEDGVLIDISEMAKEAGFKVPVAVTATLYNSILIPVESLKEQGQDSSGRIWDMLILLNLESSGCCKNHILFSVRMQMNTGSELIQMKSVIGSGDKGEPVITIMLPHED